MSENRFSVKDCSNAETNIVHLLLTLLSDIWYPFLPVSGGIKSRGILERKWKYTFLPDFSSNGTSWTSSSATCSSCGTDNVSINDVTYAE